MSPVKQGPITVTCIQGGRREVAAVWLRLSRNSISSPGWGVRARPQEGVSSLPGLVTDLGTGPRTARSLPVLGTCPGVSQHTLEAHMSPRGWGSPPSPKAFLCPCFHPVLTCFIYHPGESKNKASSAPGWAPRSGRSYCHRSLVWVSGKPGPCSTPVSLKLL